MTAKIGFVSLGCPKALVDSERIMTQLKQEGYELEIQSANETIKQYEDAKGRNKKQLFTAFQAAKSHKCRMTSQSKEAHNAVAVSDRLFKDAKQSLQAQLTKIITHVLRKHFSDRQLTVGPDVIRYLLRYGERSFAAAKRAVQRVDEVALQRKRQISVALAREILEGTD